MHRTAGPFSNSSGTEIGLKRITLAALAAPILLMVGMPARAVPITITEAPLIGTDVGMVDTLIGYGSVANSDLDTEVAFVNYLTGKNYSAVDSKKLCDGEAACDAILYSTTQLGVYALDLEATPAHYLIKTGAGSTLSYDHANNAYDCVAGAPGNNDCTHFVFANLADLAWGVFNLASLGFNVETIGKLSHVDQSSGTTTTVPEPTTLSMLGLGLLVVGFARRRSTAKLTG
jgi:hypothetical protein